MVINMNDVAHTEGASGKETIRKTSFPYAESKIEKTRFYSKRKAWVVEVCLSGKVTARFSLCVRLDNKEKVTYGSFDENGKAKVSLSFPAERKGAWQISSPVMHSAEILLLRQTGALEDKREIFCGFSSYTKRKTNRGYILCQNGHPLSLVGLLCPALPETSLGELQRAGVSLLACPPESISEAFLSACDRMGMGVWVTLPEGEDEENAFSHLLLLAEKAAAYRERHPSLLSLVFLLSKEAYAKRELLSDGLRALLDYLESPLGFLLLEQEKDSLFYTDMPCLFGKGIRQEAPAWTKDLYSALLTEFHASSDASFLLFPSSMQEGSRLAFLATRQEVGFSKSCYLISDEGEHRFPLWQSPKVKGGTAHYVLEREGMTVKEVTADFCTQAPFPTFFFPKAEKPTVYRLSLYLYAQGKTSIAQTAVLTLPRPKDQIGWPVSVERAGEYRVKDTVITVKEEPSFCLLTENGAPLFSCRAPFARYTLSARELTPLLVNEEGKTILGAWENEGISCLFSTLTEIP